MVNSIRGHFAGYSFVLLEVTCSTSHFQKNETAIRSRLASRLLKGVQMNVIPLDFAKVFDKRHEVPYSRMMNKLDFYEIRGIINAWTKKFLSDRKQ